MNTTPIDVSLRALSAGESDLSFEEYRLQRLKDTVKYAKENSPWYQKRLNTEPEDLTGIEDLRKLPFTEPDDLAQGEYEFLCISRSAVEKYTSFVSSGTTGPRKSVFFSHRDVEHITDFLGSAMHSVAPRGCTIQILLPNSPTRGMGDLLREGIAKYGSRGFLSDIFLPPEEHIRLCIENRPYLWFGDARLIYRITRETESSFDLKALGVKVMFTTISEISDSMRKAIEKAWGCRVVTHYGLTEMGFGLAVDCPESCGYHYNEFGVIAEVVDPQSGEILPEGREGELVFTALGREAMPLIRYRSHDIASIKSGPCRCGANLSVISHVKRRREAIIWYNGMELYPTLFDESMFSNDRVIDYEIYLDQEEGIIRFEAECIDAPENYEAEIAKSLCEHPALRDLEIEIKLLPLHALVSGAHFKKLIHLERAAGSVTSE